MNNQSTHPSSLQARLVWRSLAGMVLVWLVVVVLVWRDTRHEVDELLDAHLAQSASLLIIPPAKKWDRYDFTYDPPVLHRYASKVAFQVFHERELILHSPNVGHTPMAEQRQGFTTVLRGNGAAWRVFAAQSNDTLVLVAEEVSSRDDIWLAVLRNLLLPLGLGLPLLGMVIWWSVRLSLRPLKRLQEAVTQRQEGVLTPLVVAQTPAEVQPLVDALNALFIRLSERMESERRFTADAAHELRTPIAAIRVQAQVALAAHAQADEAVRQQALQDTIQGCDRAGRLVEQLLTLSRLEAQPIATDEWVDVPVLLQQVAADLAPQALQRHQVFTLDNDLPNASLGLQHGHELLLQALLRNLLDNALRYTPDGGTVRVSIIQADEQTLCVILEDSGSGMCLEDRARLGERFFRVLGSGQSGSGLGWSIVRRITQVEGVKLDVDTSADLGGLRVELRMNRPALIG